MTRTEGRTIMMGQVPVRKLVYILMAAAVGAGVMLLTASTFAPTTQGLILQAASHSGAAAAGNRNEAFILISAYNEAGPIRGIAGGSFSVAVVAAPDGANPIKKTGVAEPVSGVYKIGLAPDLSQHRWSEGNYVMGITFTSPNGSGVAVGQLIIGP
jgi:hypothetical protein